MSFNIRSKLLSACKYQISMIFFKILKRFTMHKELVTRKLIIYVTEGREKECPQSSEAWTMEFSNGRRRDIDIPMMTQICGRVEQDPPPLWKIYLHGLNQTLNDLLLTGIAYTKD